MQFPYLPQIVCQLHVIIAYTCFVFQVGGCKNECENMWIVLLTRQL